LRKATVITHRAYIVDLEGGIDAVWKRFSENARRCVRKAEKQSLEVECDTSGRLLGVFNQLLLLSTERWARQMRHPAWILRSHEKRHNPDERWKQIAERAPGTAVFWLARHHGQPVAAIVVLRGPNDRYARGAMNKELAGPTRANFLLHWLAIQDACRRGLRWYQMGEGVPGSQLARFKENFGARPYDMPELRWEALPITRLDSTARTAAKRLIGSRTLQSPEKSPERPFGDA
jgi:lipid II:glycine glycyltransferase (peptidoglycan interpeptide bridge formation enzyme)